ncbi:MAG: hypothetical protein JWM16_5091, partial [Verrucomicrobiales bacterium]|nr:hypothetical protein [Verrucomicrobiales bacterium]
QKLFGRKDDSKPTAANSSAELASTPAPAPAPPPKAPEPPKIRVWDSYGRLTEFSREDWRTKVLPLNFEAARDNPDTLVKIISSSLADGFIVECLNSARRLRTLDPKRGGLLLGVVMNGLQRFEEGQRILSETIQNHGEDGQILANLAQAYQGLEQESLAEETLWRALVLDPNLNQGFAWYLRMDRARGKEDDEALRRIAAIPGAWRAKIWLAKRALDTKNIEEGLQIYRESLSCAVKPYPADLLMEMSGHLANAGYLPEALQLVEPHFEPAVHGLQVGNNLIKIHFDLGQLDSAEKIIQRLHALKQSSWKEGLRYWEEEIIKARMAINSPMPPEEMAMSLQLIEGPVWLKADSPAIELFPPKEPGKGTVCFLGSSCEVATNSKRVQQQLSDAPTRLSQALPVFFAEQLEFSTEASARTLVPWLDSESSPFVFFGETWKDEEAATYARQVEKPCDYVVTVHLKSAVKPWSVQVRLIRTIDAQLLGTIEEPFPESAYSGLKELTRKILGLLEERAEIKPVERPAIYQVPNNQNFSYYLFGLEQLLTLRCAGMEGARSKTGPGGHDAIEGTLHLSLAEPQNICVRILLAQVLIAMKRAKPEILAQFKEKIRWHQTDHALPAPAHGVVQRLMDEAFAGV